MGALRRHIRFHGAFVAGVLAALLAYSLPPTDRILIGADLFCVVYLATTALWIRGRSGDDLREHFADADEGGLLIVLMALGAAGISMFAIAETVLSAQAQSGLRLRPVLALGAVPLGWAMVHTVMAFHYARMFYAQAQDAGDDAGDDGDADATGDAGKSGDAGGLDFPGDTTEPGPWEFLYYSFTLGMTAQTSDIGLTTTPMRRVTLFHSVLSFFYNAVIVALAVNAGMALGQGGG